MDMYVQFTAPRSGLGLCVGMHAGNIGIELDAVGLAGLCAAAVDSDLFSEHHIH